MVAILSLRFPFPGPHHCGPMAIDRPETTDGAPPACRGPDSKGRTFLFRAEWRLCRQGKKAMAALLRQAGRGVADLRPDQAIERAVWSGHGTSKERRRWQRRMLISLTGNEFTGGFAYP